MARRKRHTFSFDDFQGPEESAGAAPPAGEETEALPAPRQAPPPAAETVKKGTLRKAPESGPEPSPGESPEEDSRQARQRETLTLFREEVRRDPRNVDLRLRMANLALQAGQLQEAREALLATLRLNPNLAYPRRKLHEITPPDQWGKLEIPPPIFPFWFDLPELLRYPFAGDGLLVFLLAWVVFGVLHLLMTVSVYFGIYGLLPLMLIALPTYSFLWAFLQKTVRDCAAGDFRAPSWPDLTPSGLRAGMIRGGTALAATFLPTLVLLVFVGFHLLPYHEPQAWRTLQYGLIPCLLWAVFVFPPALEQSCLSGQPYAALNPLLLVASVIRGGASYLVLVGYCGAGLLLGTLPAGAIGLFSAAAAPGSGTVGVAGAMAAVMLSVGASLFVLLVLARAVGQHFRWSQLEARGG